MLPGVTPVHKGLAPSGLSFTKLNIVKELLLNLPFKAHTKAKFHGRGCAVRKFSAVNKHQQANSIGLKHN
jgi:hypothetical protein